MSELEQAIETIAKLRDPETGCPWDLEQTHKSLIKYLFEESYEFEYCVLKENDQAMKDELGDILLQVILHAKIAQDRGKFDIQDVAKSLKEKIIRRHPHVFGNSDEKISKEKVAENWKKIKQEEKSSESEKLSFPNEYMHFPSLTTAYKIGKKSSEVNFDWENYSQVSYKVEEEWQELKEELAPVTLNKDRIEEEIGDFLFSIAQLARHLKVDPDMALRKANQKFLERFAIVEELIKKDNKGIQELSTKEMDHYWNLAKKR